MIIFMTILPTIILFVPGIVAEKAKQSAWMVLLFIPPFLGAGVLLILAQLEKRFPRHSLPQYAEVILGKFIGKTIGILYLLFFLLANFLVIREFSEFVTITFFPHTPLLLFNIVIIIVAVYATWEGLEVIARMTQFLLPLFVVSLLINLILPLPEGKPGFLLPLLEDGLKPLLLASVTPAAWFGETIILALLFPFVNKPSEVKSKGIAVLIVIALLMSAETLITIAVFGPELTASFFIPFWELTRYIEYSSYVQRIETLITAFWVGSIMLKATFFNYLICLTTRQVFGLKSFKFILIPLALLQVFLATFSFSTTLELIEFLSKILPPIAFIFELGIPLILLGTALIRKQSVKASSGTGRVENE